MDIRDLEEAKTLIGDIAAQMPEGSPYREDFAFFASINCTTQSEYREELKAFLERFILETAIFDMPNPVKERYSKLAHLYKRL